MAATAKPRKCPASAKTTEAKKREAIHSFQRRFGRAFPSVDSFLQRKHQEIEAGKL